MIYYIVGVIAAFLYLLKEKSSVEELIQKLHAKGVTVKISHYVDKTHLVEISKELAGRQTQHANFLGSNLLQLLEEALKYIEKHLSEWFNGGGYC